MKHNEHVILYKKFLWFKSKLHHKQLAEIFHYTEWHKEIDPNWTPFTQDEIKYIDD